MPKERFHLLLAEETLRHLERSGRVRRFSVQQRHGFLLGAVLPDVLFYDLPFFSLAGSGRELHRLQKPHGLEFFRQWSEKAVGRYPPAALACVLGVACHFLADGYWHGFIGRLSAGSPWVGNGFLGHSEKFRHLWLESELESYWMARLGPPDGYFPVLSAFRRGIGATQTCLTLFKDLLAEAGMASVPTESRIGRCLVFQTVLLRQFALPRWERWRSRLLSARSTRRLGVLLVPPRPTLREPEPSEPQREGDPGALCTWDFMGRSVSFLSNRLSTLLPPS